MAIINILYIEKFYNLKTLLLSEEKKFTAEIPSCHEPMLLDNLFESCYLKVKRRRKITEPLKIEFMGKIMFLIIVYK